MKRALIEAITFVTLIFAILAFAAHAHAGESRSEATAAVGLGRRVLLHQPFERAAAIGVKYHLSENWFVKPEVGGWLGGPGRPSWFMAAPFGLQVWIPTSGLYATVAVGPSRISTPDDQLGGHFQFCPEFGLGLKTEHVNLEAVWMHFSSAGIFMPNQGRDFVGVQAGVGL